jgi:two-component system, OmpR family, sensor histidine kinase KdpD
MMPGDFDPPAASNRPSWQHKTALIFFVALGLASVTATGLQYFTALGVTVITLLYMLCVLWAAYCLRFAQALLTAVVAVLLINYCFIEPRYTFWVASLQSWVVLTVFAILALTVSHAMQQLKWQMQRAQLAAQQSRFFQSLAELLATQVTVAQLLQSACQHVQDVFGWPVSVVALSEAGTLTWLAGEPLPEIQASSVQWALDYQRPIGAGTTDWPGLGATLLPFGFPQHEVLLVKVSPGEADVHFLRLLTHQVAQATIKLRQQLALAQATQDASEANFKKTLLTALSHDMRTPLTAIIGAVNVLADQQISLAPAQAGQLLSSIQAEAGYLTQATENILTLVKLDVGASSLHLDWEAPQEVIQHVVHRYAQRTPPLSLQLSMPDASLYGEVLVKMDAVLVAHALANLVDNALQWRSAETPIEIALTVEPPWLVLSVLNHGPGFPPGFVVSAFDARMPSMAGTRGFGLGLSIVQTLMQLHGGELRITTAEDQRTCVSMRLPFVYAADLMQDGKP